MNGGFASPPEMKSNYYKINVHGIVGDKKKVDIFTMKLVRFNSRLFFDNFLGVVRVSRLSIRNGGC